MVGGRGTPPVGMDEDDLLEADEGDALEVIELEGYDGNDGSDPEETDYTGEVMDEDESVLFDPPEVDDAAIVFSAHSKSVFTVALDPSGSIAVSGGEDDVAFVWSVVDGKIMFKCEGHQDSVVCAAFNNDGSMVATGDLAGAVNVWKVATGKLVWNFEVSDMEWLLWHPVASVIIAGTVDGSSWMWKIPSGDCKTYAGPNCPASNGRFHPDGRRLCVGYGDGSLRVWDLKSTAVQHTITDLHSATVTSMDIHRDGNLLFTGSVDGTARLINPNTGKVVGNLQESDSGEDAEPDSVETVGLSHSHALAATGTLAGKLLVWDLNTQKSRHDPVSLEGGITRLAFDSATGNTIFCASLDGTASMWDARTGQIVRKWTGHRGHVLDLAVGPMANFILTSSSDGTVRSFSTV